MILRSLCFAILLVASMTVATASADDASPSGAPVAVPPSPALPLNEDLATVCPLISPDLLQHIVSEHIAPPACKTGCKGCGCKGGPGYRGPDHKCVSYRNIVQVCGPPPHAGCIRECAKVSAGCEGRAWLKDFATKFGLTVVFAASQKYDLEPDGSAPAASPAQ